MSPNICPHEAASLAASRRGVRDPSIAAHIESCSDCAGAIALDRALGSLATADAARPFPSAEALRLGAALFVEQNRLARRAAVRLGIHALAFSVCVGLFAAVCLVAQPKAPATLIWSSGPLCALVVVGVSLWSLVRRVDDLDMTS